MTRRAFHELLVWLAIGAVLLAVPVAFGLLTTGGR